MGTPAASKHRRLQLRGLVLVAFGLMAWAALPTPAPAQEAGTEAQKVFRTEAEMPPAFRQYRQERRDSWLGLGPGGAGPVHKASFRQDAHEGVDGYVPSRNCVDCHAEDADDIHTIRLAITCRQCHTDEPISGVFNYDSPMNPIRRHAYVCKKCHEGASPSFATYVVHEPPILAAATLENFPLLGYAGWFMVLLAGGVFAFFLPFTIAWGVRDGLAKLRRKPHV